MSRSITSTLRPFLHTRPQPIASTSTLPSTSYFSTTPPNLASRVKQNAKRKKSKVLSLRSARESEDSNPPDPVLGYSLPPATTSRQATQSTPAINRWEGCRLQKTIFTPEQVYSAPLPQSGVEGSREYIHGLSGQDQDILFGAVPYTTLGLSVGTDAGVEEQERQVENMKRILDLRNASKAGIEVVNRQRIVEEFGRKRVLIQEGEWGYEGEPQSGGSEVQGKSSSFNLHIFFSGPPIQLYSSLPQSPYPLLVEGTHSSYTRLRQLAASNANIQPPYSHPKSETYTFT